MNPNWAYSDEVKEHFTNPKNILKDMEESEFDGKGVEGNVKCGDEMMVFVKIDKDKNIITDCKWKTYGCASAIASMSALSEMVKGWPVEKAYLVTPQDITEILKGLPQNKIHCSVLGDKALRAAIDNYYEKNGLDNPVKDQSVRIVCKCMNITDKDIEEAINAGAKTYEDLQQKTKCGTVCGECKGDIMALLDIHNH
jgi:nitrogen fixation protein NifU and related proteins